MSNTRAWIHCRVSNKKQHDLLQYQKKLLTNFCEITEMKIVGTTSLVDSGDDASCYALLTLISEIKRRSVDVVLVYDRSRITRHLDKFMEFQMFCEMNKVVVLDLQVFNSQTDFLLL